MTRRKDFAGHPEDILAGKSARTARPLLHEGFCLVTGCQSELHSCGMCFRHERAWRKARAEPAAAFLARASALARGEDCLVAGCAREQPAAGYAGFHDEAAFPLSKACTPVGTIH